MNSSSIFDDPPEPLWKIQARCSHEEIEIREKAAVNGAIHRRPTCTLCGWEGQPVPHEKNKNKRREGTDNKKHLEYWRERSPNNVLRCFICGVREDEPCPGFEAHHGVAIAEGGTDELGCAIPLCTDCHHVQQAMHRRIRAFRQKNWYGMEGVI